MHTLQKIASDATPRTGRKARWRTLSVTSACLIAVALLFAGEGASGPAAAQDPAAAERGPALPNATYFTLRHDVRRCAFPLCGGFFVERVNREATRCADGSLQAQCYVAELALGALGLSPEQEGHLRTHEREFLLRGSLSLARIEGRRLGRFTAEEAWHGHAGVTPEGSFYRVRDRGIVCVTAPCPSFSARRLNRDEDSFHVADVDFSAVSPDPSDAQAQLAQPQGLLLAGRRHRVSGPAGSAVGLVASEYYLPFPEPPQPQSCGGLVPGGPQECPAGQFCSFAPDAICGAADAPGVCTPIPQSCEPGAGEPVCGCDGKPYESACEAAQAGVSDSGAAPESCRPQVCGTIRGLTCNEGEVCITDPGQCNVSDAAGTCQPRAVLCPDVFIPVCGCDGNTYPNACFAARKGVSIDHDGECAKP